jgi:hypothetical protein
MHTACTALHKIIMLLPIPSRVPGDDCGALLGSRDCSVADSLPEAAAHHGAPTAMLCLRAAGMHGPQPRPRLPRSGVCLLIACMHACLIDWLLVSIRSRQQGRIAHRRTPNLSVQMSCCRWCMATTSCRACVQRACRREFAAVWPACFQISRWVCHGLLEPFSHNNCMPGPLPSHQQTIDPMQVSGGPGTV